MNLKKLYKKPVLIAGLLSISACATLTLEMTITSANKNWLKMITHFRWVLTLRIRKIKLNKHVKSCLLDDADKSLAEVLSI